MYIFHVFKGFTQCVYKIAMCTFKHNVPTHGKKMCGLTMVDSVDHDEGGDPLYGFTPLWLEGGDRLLGEGLCLQF